MYGKASNILHFMHCTVHSASTYSHRVQESFSFALFLLLYHHPVTKQICWWRLAYIYINIYRLDTVWMIEILEMRFIQCMYGYMCKYGTVILNQYWYHSKLILHRIDSETWCGKVEIEKLQLKKMNWTTQQKNLWLYLIEPVIDLL